MTCIGLLRGGRPGCGPERGGSNRGTSNHTRVAVGRSTRTEVSRASWRARVREDHAHVIRTRMDLDQRLMTVDCGVRSLLIAVLASLGFVALAADHGPSWKIDRQVAECAPRPGSSADLAERAPRLPAPMRVVARTGRTSPAARPTGGCAGLHGERSVAGMHVARVAPVSGADPPRPGDGLQRRQPEGRAPPMGPSAA